MVTKSKSYLASQPNKNTFSVFNTINPTKHLSKRKIVAHALSTGLTQHLEPMIAEQVDIFICRLRAHSRDQQNSAPVNLSELCQQFALDVVGMITFGHHFNLQNQDTHLSFYRTVKMHSVLYNVFLQQPVLKQMIAPFITFLEFLGFGDPFLRTVNHIIAQRQKNSGDGKHDFYSVSAKAVDAKDMVSEGGLLLLAGGETVSSGLGALFFYLSSNPSCYSKLAQEIRSTFPCVSEIRRGKTLSSCQYLTACIDEALRMSPPISATLWRTQVQRGDKPIAIDGHTIPYGVDFSVNTYAFHHNEDIFPNPFCFNPDRWLVESAADIQRRAFNVFSTGLRGCPGKSVAYLEMSLVIAKTLWYFDFNTRPDPVRGTEPDRSRVNNLSGENQQPQFEVSDRYTSSYEGPFLTFRLRDNQ